VLIYCAKLYQLVRICGIKSDVAGPFRMLSLGVAEEVLTQLRTSLALLLGGLNRSNRYIYIYVADQQIHSGNICLSYILYYLHVQGAFTRILIKYNKQPHCICKTTQCYNACNETSIIILGGFYIYNVALCCILSLFL
jgi:hypothetical protein